MTNFHICYATFRTSVSEISRSDLTLTNSLLIVSSVRPLSYSLCSCTVPKLLSAVLLFNLQLASSRFLLDAMTFSQSLIDPLIFFEYTRKNSVLNKLKNLEERDHSPCDSDNSKSAPYSTLVRFRLTLRMRKLVGSSEWAVINKSMKQPSLSSIKKQ